MLADKAEKLSGWLKRPEFWALLCGLLTALAGLIVFYLLPEIYRGRADIRVRNDNTVSTLADVTTQQFIDQRISTLLERAKAPEQLREVLLSYEDELDVLPEKGSSEWEAMLKDLRGRIYLDWRRTEKDVPGYRNPILLVTASYVVVESDYPALPAHVANTLAEKIIQDYSLVRVQDEQKNLQVIETEIARLSDELDDEASKISEYELNNPGTDSPYRRLLRNQINELAEQVIALELGRDTIVRLLTSIDERLDVNGDLSQRTNSQAFSEISALALQARSELNELVTSYSQSHPEVARLNTLVQGLEQKLGGSSTEFFAQERGRAELSAQKSELESRLIETEKVLSGLEAELVRLREELSMANIGSPAYNQMLLDKATIERELVKLRRKAALSKLAIKFQQEEMVTQLFLNREASPSSDPVYPNPLGWGVLIAYVSLLVALGGYLLLRRRDRPVSRIIDIREVFDGGSLVAVVPTHKP